MLSSIDYIKLSLELNLFFARIAKEHSIFIQTGFTGRDTNLAQEADNLKIQFEALLAETIFLSNGIISQDVVSSGEFVTPFTLNSERVSQYYTGVQINSNLTQMETTLVGSTMDLTPPPLLEQRVFILNERAIALTKALAQFKSKILNDVLACRLFTTNYPLLLDHILREAKFYLSILVKLQKREEINTKKDFLNQEIFWNRIMGEHAEFIRGLLDPTEEDLMNTANEYGKEFAELTKQAIEATEQTLSQVTSESLKATKGLRDFKASGTKGLIECKIKAIAYPLIGDHVLREANHFIRILKQYDRH